MSSGVLRNPIAAQSLQSLLAQHKTTTAQLQEANEKAAKQALSHAEALSSVCAQTLNRDVCTIFTAQTTIDNELKTLYAEVEKAQGNMEQWANQFQAMNESLKELGDISNWATHMSQDMDDIVTCIEALSAAATKQ